MITSAALFRKKNPNPAESSGKLAPVLSAWDLTFLGIGAIIGTGIFVLTGHAAAEQSGPAVVLSFIVSGIACAFAALAYAELAAAVGGCGSAYGYSYAAFGEMIAWIIGWDLLLEYGVSVAAVANGWSGYFNTGLKAMGLALPMSLTKGPLAPVDDKIMTDANFAKLPENSCDLGSVVDMGGHKLNLCHHFTGAFMNLPAAAIILVLMFLLIRGVKDSARLNNVMVFIKLLTITVFVCVASTHVDSSLWHPFMPFGWFDNKPDGTTIGVLAGASVVFFAYVGFDAVSTSVEETKNPQKDVPIGILSSLGFCTVIYIIVSGLLTGIVKYDKLNVSSPVAFALEQIGIHWAAALVATGVIAGLTTVMLVLYYGLTRIIFAMSRDGLLPPAFSVVDEKRHTPIRTTVICGLVMAVMAGLIPLGALAELVNIGTLAAFVLVCAGVIVLRVKQPDLPRPFKAPGGLVVPVLGVLSCGALIAFLPFVTHLRFVVWLALGMIIYFTYSVHHSHLAGKK
jgi:APA family basic amino acid/polyamine antiporter